MLITRVEFSPHISSSAYEGNLQKDNHLLSPKDITQQLLNMFPGRYDKFVNEDGTTWTMANKAIYGTGDAAKLWHDLVDATLKKNGYAQNGVSMIRYIRLNKKPSYQIFEVSIIQKCNS